MIISKTPFRISFFGGGTDYPDWYRKNGGAVLATAINKYCYISCRYLPPFFEYKHRIVYSKAEMVKSTEEIQHCAVRAAIEHMDIKEGLEIHHDGDLPARTGLGSSSSFTVGILNALYALKNERVSGERLSREAIYLERDVLKENVGSQDQIIAATGGFKKIEFLNENDFTETPIPIKEDKLQELQSHLMIFFTGIQRYASDIAKENIKNIPKKEKELKTMYQMVDEALAILSSNARLTEFGKLLHESWMIKKSLSDLISTPFIDEIYDTALQGGAIGGKILGAGGGGFLLVFARPEDHPTIKEKLKKFLYIPFSFEQKGSQIVVFQPDLTPRYG